METDDRFMEAGLYLSYMIYHATGEGVMSCIAVAGSRDAAERTLREKVPEYFHRAIVTKLLDSSLDNDGKRLLEWIPRPVKAILAEIPGETGEYYAELNYNLA